jgi:hypothetical protein
MTNATKAPQSCYPEEIETLREMLTNEHERAEMFSEQMALPEYKNRTRQIAYSRGVCEKRIEALRTAIEALGGVL